MQDVEMEDRTEINDNTLRLEGLESLSYGLGLTRRGHLKKSDECMTGRSLSLTTRCHFKLVYMQRFCHVNILTL